MSHHAQPIFFFFLRRSLALSPKLNYSNRITVYCSLEFPGSSDPPTSASQVAGTIDAHYQVQLILFFVETGSLHVAQANLKLWSLNNPPNLTSQSAGIIDMHHHAQPSFEKYLSDLCLSFYWVVSLLLSCFVVIVLFCFNLHGYFISIRKYLYRYV